jgi:hypothetical protein
LGIDCLACGAQRAFFLLMKGHFTEGFLVYPPLIPVLMLILLVVIQKIFPKAFDQKHVYRYSFFVLVIVAVNYSIRLITS